MEQVQNFVGLINNKQVVPRKRDGLLWKGVESGRFSVKAYYSNSLEEGAPLKAFVKFMWNHYLPSKVSFFAWEAWRGKVLTMKQLKKRGFQLASICPFCRKEEDILEHMLIHRPLIWELWTTILSVRGFSWVCPYMVKDLFSSWSQLPMKKNDRKLWWAAPLGLYWAI